MKRLILGAVITGALGTAGATQWEYAALTHELSRYPEGSNATVFKWIERTREVTFENRKGSSGSYFDNIPIESFWNQVFKSGNRFKDKDVRGWLFEGTYGPFLNQIGANGWELVDVTKNDQKLTSGTYIELTTYIFKRELTK